MKSLKIYKVNPEVELPKFQTKQSACFDLAYQPNGKYEIYGRSSFGKPFARKISATVGAVSIAPGERLMMPTGLIFDIPKGYSVRVHPRSGLALNSGITLVNCEGVIDSDYIEELFILLLNASEDTATFRPGDRVAQAELVKSESYKLEETTTRPEQKTDRVGGMGSTGKNKKDVDKKVEV